MVTPRKSVPHHPAQPPALTDLQTHWPPSRWASVGVVIAVSGGSDSVALLRAMSELRQSVLEIARGFVIVAHFNHKLRGSDSDADQRFVARLAAELELEFYAESGDGQTSDEAGLADQRMSFLIRTAHRYGCRYIATAHHRDDNVETMLHQLFRGSGAAGLTAMPMFRNLVHNHRPSDVVLVRPWIQTPRQDLTRYLDSIGQGHRHDGSNDETQYTRNWIRHDVLPLIRSRIPHCDNAISNAADSIRQWRIAIDHYAVEWLDQRVNQSATTEIGLDSETPSAVVVAALQMLWARRGWPLAAMTRSHWSTLYDMIAARNPGPHALPGDLMASVLDNQVLLRAESPSRRPH